MHELLTDYHWPGNVRELQNIIRRAVLMSDEKALNKADFSGVLQQKSATGQTSFSSAIHLLHQDGRPKTLQEIEYEALEKTLNMHHNNVTKTASILGIAKSTFYKKRSERSNN